MMDLMYLSFDKINPSIKEIESDIKERLELKLVDYGSRKEFNDKLNIHTKIFIPNYDLREHIDSLRLSYQEGNGFGVFLYVDGILAGALDVERTNDFVYILNFGIVPELREKGIGKKFIEDSLEIIKEQMSSRFDGIYLLVSKKNKTAKKIYKSLGFEVKN